MRNLEHRYWQIFKFALVYLKVTMLSIRVFFVNKKACSTMNVFCLIKVKDVTWRGYNILLLIGVFRPILCSLKSIIRKFNFVELNKSGRLSMCLFKRDIYTENTKMVFFCFYGINFINIKMFWISKVVMVIVNRYFHRATTVVKTTFITAPQGDFIAPHVWEIEVRKNLTNCRYSRFDMIFSGFRKTETKNSN